MIKIKITYSSLEPGFLDSFFLSSSILNRVANKGCLKGIRGRVLTAELGSSYDLCPSVNEEGLLHCEIFCSRFLEHQVGRHASVLSIMTL